MKIVLLVAGLLIGGLVGFLSRPDSADLNMAGVSVEVQTNRTAAAGSDGQIATGKWQRIATFALGGGVLGFAAGFAADRRSV